VTAPRMHLVTDVTVAEFEQLARQDHVRDRLERLLAIEAEVGHYIQLLCDRRRAGHHKTPWPDAKRLAATAGIEIPEDLG
jgi:hypothetical protein